MVKKSILAKVGDKINYKLIKDGYKTENGNTEVTEEMAIETIINADVPSTQYTSNLDYEFVDTGFCNIISLKKSLTLPDESIIPAKNYVYNALMDDKYIINERDLPQNNFDTFGNVKVYNTKVYNFDKTSYCKAKIDFSDTKTAANPTTYSPSIINIRVHIRTPEEAKWTTHGRVISAEDESNFATIEVTKEKAALYHVVDGVRKEYVIASNLNSDTDYWFNWKWGSETLESKWSIDGKTWTENEKVKSVKSFLKAKEFNIGSDGENEENSFKGIIYINDLEIYSFRNMQMLATIAEFASYHGKGSLNIWTENDDKNYVYNKSLGFYNGVIYKNGVASNLSGNINYPGQNWSVGDGFVIYFTTGDTVSQQGNVFITSWDSGLLINSNFRCARFGLSPKTVAKPNTNYHCKVTLNSNYYGYYEVFDDDNNLLCSGNGIDSNSTSGITLGSKYSYYNTPFQGTIDLTKSYVFKSTGEKTYFCDIQYQLPGIKLYKLTDTGLSTPLKLFDYHYKTQSEFVNNTSKVGNATVDESTGVASGFTSSAKLKLEKSTYFTNERKFYTKVKTGDVSGTSEFLWNYSLDKGVGVYRNYWRIWDNGGIYSTSVSPNTSYWTCVLQNASGSTLYVLQDDGQYTSSTLPDLNQWVNACSTSGIIFGDNDFCYGGSTVTTSEYWTGTIDLLNSWVDTDGEKRFLAYFTKPQDKASLYINSEKDNNLCYEKDGLQLNVSKVGSAIIDEKCIASNFGSNSYVTPGPINFGTGTWEMVFKVQFKSGTEYQRICGTKDNTSVAQIVIAVKPDNKLVTWISSNGAGWDITSDGIESSNTLIANTDYYIKAQFTGTNYIISSSIDNIIYTEEINVSSGIVISNPNSNFWIGNSESISYAWQGTIDLKESYIQIGTNEKKYFAETIKKRYDISSLYSEFIDNITIPSHALYDYVNGGWKLSTNTPEIAKEITVDVDNAEITVKEI